MNAEEILAMKPGRELDRLTAERVLGVDRMTARVGVDGTDEPHYYWGRHLGHSPAGHYSSRISDAWLVFEAALLKHGTASIHADMEDYGRGAFFGDGPERVVTVTVGHYSSTGPVCEAICKAALLAAWAPA